MNNSMTCGHQYSGKKYSKAEQKRMIKNGCFIDTSWKDYIKEYKRTKGTKRKMFWKPILKRLLLILIVVAVVLVMAWEYSRVMVIYYDMIGLPDSMRAF